MKPRITILTVGDSPDRDTYRKFHKEKPFILKAGFDYATTSYKRLLERGTGPLKTKKVIAFLFFPFLYWNEFIEHKNYKGVYGNRAFYEKFIRFWAKADRALRDSLSGKNVVFVNPPLLCGLYRDKLTVAKRFLHTNISSPKLYKISRPEEIGDLLEKSRSFFVKPRYGSTGKGITFLSRSNWQTNFAFKNGKIINRPSDRGWKFRDITKKKGFLRELLRKDVLIESVIDSPLLKKAKADFRVYTFFGEIIYMKRFPRHLVKKAKTLAADTSRALGVNLIGMDIMTDRNLKDLYVVDVDLFPDLPKTATFNISQCMIKKIVKLNKNGGLRYEKIYTA